MGSACLNFQKSVGAESRLRFALSDLCGFFFDDLDLLADLDDPGFVCFELCRPLGRGFLDDFFEVALLFGLRLPLLAREGFDFFFDGAIRVGEHLCFRRIQKRLSYANTKAEWIALYVFRWAAVKYKCRRILNCYSLELRSR